MKTYIIGNGLGMALDPKAFDIGNAFRNSLSEIDASYRRVLETAFPNKNGSPPEKEEELGLMHQAEAACQFLEQLENLNVPLLSQEGRDFPTASRLFINRTALQFWNCSTNLPGPFIDNLCDRIKERNINIAVLNYDKLLYDPFISRGICNGRKGYLIDGFVGGNIDLKALEHSYQKKNYGHYMHLHGSPLFVEEDGKIRKLDRNEITSTPIETRRHVVLTSFDRKKAVINQSFVLSLYWQALKNSLVDSEQVLIFGYRGQDAHLNETLVEAFREPTKRVIVVEWEGAGEKGERQHFWKKTLKIEDGRLTLKQMPNILSYAWDD
jgi:hypothetical protein